MTLVKDVDHACIRGITTILQDTYLLSDHLHNQEILDFLHIAHTSKQGTNLIQFNHNPKMTQLTLKYICIIPLKWKTL